VKMLPGAPRHRVAALGMSLMDRAIAAVSPAWGLRRAASRAQLTAVQSLGDRFQTRRNGDHWRINDPAMRRFEALKDRPLPRIERERLRWVFEINPFAVKMKASLLNNLIGYGITGTVKASKAIQGTWADWVKVCDFDQVFDLYGLQQLIAETWLDDGEVFIVQRVVAGAAVHPLRLQVLDVDMLETTTTAIVAGSNRIRDGIEYSPQGRPVAYWFRSSREVDQFADPVRVPAEQVIHLFHRKRAGQWRGRPFFESVIDVLTDVDDYLDAESVRKKIEACFVAFRSPSVDYEDPAIGKVSTDPLEPNDPPDETFYPGMIVNGRPGEQVTFGEPKANEGLADFMRWAGLRMAAGARTTYEHATGDLSNVNYSSYRAGALEFQRQIGRLQWLMFIPRLLNRIEQWWIEGGIASGLIGQRAPAFKWTPPPFGTVDPEKEAKAKRLEVASGFESLRNVVAERGFDLDDLTNEIAADLQMLKDKGLDALVTAMFAPPAGSGGGQIVQTAQQG
jgi:lambda family phage portal protein